MLGVSPAAGAGGYAEPLSGGYGWAEVCGSGIGVAFEKHKAATGAAVAHTVSGVLAERTLFGLSPENKEPDSVRQVEIDIRTKIVAPDVRIWRMFPGFQYEFLTEFRKSAAVFLEFPGLSLPDGLINESTDRIRERIIRSWQVRQWLSEYKNWSAGSKTNASPTKPSPDLSTYVSHKKNKNYGRHFGAIQALFNEAQQGDLVVVPNKIPTRQVLIGEFSDPPGVKNGLKPGGFYRDEQMPYRRVKWFPPVNELRIPSDVSDVLRTPTAISVLPNTYYKTILELSYNSYIRGDEVFCKFNIDTDDFNAKNTFDLGALAQLAVAIASDIPDSELSATLHNYLDADFPTAAQPTLTLNMNSWGSGGYRGSNYAPLVLGCLLAYLPVALANSGQTQMKVVNSVERTDACVTDADKPVTSDIEERVAERLVLIGVPALKKACERALHLKQEGRLHTDARAK